MTGKLIVLYGTNNLGKTTQAKKLVERLNQEGKKAIYLKYPIYDLAPSGPLINAYLRQGNPQNLSPREAQLLYVLNRTQYETTLKETLSQGTHVVAEDYIGTGLCWGIGRGVDETFMKEINSHLYKEDLVFLFDGMRFTASIETTHQHETDNTLMEHVRTIHLRLAQDYGWIPIQANESIDIIHETLWKKVTEMI